jgi:hypothetical protein
MDGAGRSRLRQAFAIVTLLALSWGATRLGAYPLDCPVRGVAHNQSYTTLCAEVDNVNIPLIFSNVSAYRITATHPAYLPASIYDGGADFTDCPTLTENYIWLVGTRNDGAAEFLQSGYADGDVHYAPDNPAEGIDEAATNFPRELNSTTMRNQYIWFTANEAGDANVELKIGATLKVAFIGMVGTQQVVAETWNGTNWISRGAKTFSHPSNLIGTWNIPDFTWLPGTDANGIHLHVVGPTGGVTSTDALGFYDYVELAKRDQLFETVTRLYDDGVVVVDAVNIDFWWRAPEQMTVSVIGGGTHTNAHYFRISRLTPTNASWNQFFILYEDGNARILPLPPDGPYFGHFGASIILGPSADSARPFCGIDSITLDPDDLSFDVLYDDGSAAQVELWSDRERTVVDVDGITYDTATQSFARLRSMWVHDGKHDLDRVATEDGAFSAVQPWTSTSGSWWRLLHTIPSYHNTYAPDFDVAVLEPNPAFLQREAESFDAAVNHTLVGETNASGGLALRMSASGGEATYTFTLEEARPATTLLLRYADADGGDNGNNPGNLIEAYLNGVRTSRTWSMNTGGTNAFEWAPDLALGDLDPGTHSVRIVTSPLTDGVVLDQLRFISRPSAPQSTNVFYSREAESAESGSGYTVTNRSSASGGSTLKLGTNGATAQFAVVLSNAVSNAFAIVRYAEDLPPNKVEIRVGGVLRAKFATQLTRPSAQVQNHALEKGPTDLGGTPYAWWKYGSCGQETWGAQTGMRGVGFYAWMTPDNFGGFGQNIPVTNSVGHVYSFLIHGKAENNYTSSTLETFMKMEFWKTGESTNRFARTNSVYHLLVSNRNAWVQFAMTVTNNHADVDEVRIMTIFGNSVNKTNATAASWDNAYFVQTGTNDWNYFSNSPALFLGDLPAGTNVFVLSSESGYWGVELDRFELATIDRANSEPRVLVPGGLSLPVGASTSFVVHVAEPDPDCVTLAASNAPPGAYFTGATFAWTGTPAAAGTTAVVHFVANDGRGAANSTFITNVHVVIPFDADADALGDAWEWTWFTNLSANAMDDDDGDDQDNYAEFIAGTAPGDASAYFHVTNAQGSGIRYIHVPTQQGRKYTVLFADGSLSNNMAWQLFGNTNNGVGTWMETNATSSSFIFVDDAQPATTGGEPAGGSRHYRVRVELP